MTARKPAPAKAADPATDSGGITPAPATPAVLPIAALSPHPANPRDDLGDLAELTASIREVGILQPLVVATAAAHEAGGWPTAVDPAVTHVVLAGHRRRAAAAEAGLAEVPVIVRDDLAGADALVVMLAENDPAKRRALEPLAEARAFAALAERGWSQRQIAQRVGCGQAHVSKRTALLRLPEPAIEALAAGRITAADAGELAKLAGDPEEASSALAEIGTGEWNSAARVVGRRLAEAERARQNAALLEEARAAGIKVVDYGRLGGSAYTKQLADGADPAPHQEAGCLVAVIAGGRRELYCLKPQQHEGTAAAVPAWTRHNGGRNAEADAARAAEKRQADAATRARKTAAGQLAAQPVTPARAAELLSVAMLARHADAQCLDTAVRWLRAADIGPAGGDHYAYADAVRAGGSAADIRRLAVAMALAGDERATATTGAAGPTNEKWAGRQVAYLDRLIHEAGYQPGEWEAGQLEEARWRVQSRGVLSCEACGCRHGKTCGKYGYDQDASRYRSCDAEPGPDGIWVYYCNCRQAAEQEAEAGASERDDLFDAIEVLVFLTTEGSQVVEDMSDALTAATGQAAGVLAEAFAAQDGNGDLTALLEAVRVLHRQALPYAAEWPERLRDAVAELEELGALDEALNAAGDGSNG